MKRLPLVAIPLLAAAAVVAMLVIERGEGDPDAPKPPAKPAAKPAEAPAGEPGDWAPAPVSRTPAPGIPALRSGFTGRVTDLFGIPVLGARVTLHAEASPASDTPLAESQSGPDGRFVIASTGAATCCLIVSHHEFAPLEPLRHLAPDPTTLVDVGDLRLTAGLVLRGLVLDDGARAVAGATVELEEELAEVGPFAPFRRTRTTDAAGRFAFLGLLRSRYRLRVQPPAPLAPAVVHDVEPQPATSRPLEVRLAPGVRLAGRVLDARGSVAAGARVVLETRGDGESPEATTCDELGRFAWPALSAGDYLLRATARSALPLSVEQPIRVPVPADVELRLPAGSDVRLRFTGAADRGGVLPDRASIEMIAAVSPAEAAPAVGVLELPVQGSAALLPGVPAGVWRLRARLKGFAPALSATFTVEDRPIAVAVLLVAGGSLHGTLRDARGQPLAGAEIVAVSADAPAEATLRLGVHDAVLGRAHSDAEGRYRLADLPPGRLQVLVPALGTAPLAAIELVSGDDVECPLAASAAVGRLRVVLTADFEGKHPVLQIWAVRGTFQARRAFPATRVLHFEGIPAGRYGLRLLTGATEAVYVEVSPGANVEARLP